MNFGTMFGMFESEEFTSPSLDNYCIQSGPRQYEPTINDTAPSSNWGEEFAGFKSQPMLYNLEGYISPYSSGNWGGTSQILQSISEMNNLPYVRTTIDPNKIFTSEMNGLRNVAAEQQRLVKMIEHHLKASLSEKGKVGLTEEDIEAFNAITTGRNTISNIYKEEVAIKKNIAELKIKQSQANNNNTSGGGSTGSGGNGVTGNNVVEVGRAILDNIFGAPTPPPVVPTNAYQPTDPNAAESYINNIVTGVGNNIADERNGVEKMVTFENGDTSMPIIVLRDKNGNIRRTDENIQIDPSSITPGVTSVKDEYGQFYNIL